MATTHEIRIGGCYSNGDFGRRWVVRQVLGFKSGQRLRYKVLVGDERRKTFECATDEFVEWARYEVVRNENSWERVDSLVR